MISKARLCKKLDEIKYYMKENPLLAERAIDSVKEMVKASEDKGLRQKILYLCMECVKDGYSVGIHEQKGNRRVRLDGFVKVRKGQLQKRIKEML